jgi:hypothetical protein
VDDDDLTKGCFFLLAALILTAFSVGVGCSIVLHLR